jgi:SnoaL-like domain
MTTTPEETVIRMFVYTDRRDWAALRGIFGDTVTIDWTSLNGGDPLTLSGDELVAGWRSALGGFKATQHLVGNVLVEELAEEHAVVTCYGHATHLLPNDLGESRWTVGGHYRVELVRRNGDWRVVAATFTATWGDGNKELLALASRGSG